MILDSLSSAADHNRVHPGLRDAFEWLDKCAASAACGSHEVAEDVIAIVSEYRTASAAEMKWEAHRRHLDLQAVLSGSELAGWSPVGELVVDTHYDAQKDTEFYHPPSSMPPRLRLRPGLFVIFFPWDGHQPGVADGNPGPVRKVVFKLRIPSAI